MNKKNNQKLFSNYLIEFETQQEACEWYIHSLQLHQLYIHSNELRQLNHEEFKNELIEQYNYDVKSAAKVFNDTIDIFGMHEEHIKNIHTIPKMIEKLNVANNYMTWLISNINNLPTTYDYV